MGSRNSLSRASTKGEGFGTQIESEEQLANQDRQDRDGGYRGGPLAGCFAAKKHEGRGESQAPQGIGSGIAGGTIAQGHHDIAEPAVQILTLSEKRVGEHIGSWESKVSDGPVSHDKVPVEVP